MLPYLQFFFLLMVIIAAAKTAGYLSNRLGQPAVAGEVFIGLLLGPSLLDMYHWPIITDAHMGETMHFLAEVGVLLLMFLAGLELHISDLLNARRTALLAGSLGFLTPLIFGAGLALLFSIDPRQAYFIGLILAPTSVSISAQTLMELKALRSKVGISMLGAAVVDDILVVVALSLSVVALGGQVGSGAGEILMIILRMILYVIIASLVGFFLIPKISVMVDKLQISQGLVSFVFITILLYAWTAEVLGHITPIIGAFLAGLFFSRSMLRERILRNISTLAYGVFVPVFFINIGLSANVRTLSAGSFWLLLLVLLVAIVSKILGCGLGGYLGKLTPHESLQLGVSMVSRGEVGLITISVGIAEGWFSTEIASIGVIVIILTTLITPPALRALIPKSTPPQANSQAAASTAD